MTRSRVSVYAALLAIILLLGVGYCREREARKRATHDLVADSLARDTRAATGAVLTADTVWRASEVRWRTARGRVDTLRLPPEAREAIRACDALVLTCRARVERADTLIAVLRRELDHALNPPPGKRLSYFGEVGYDLLDKGAVVGLGATVRLAGPVSLLGKFEGTSQVSAERERPRMRGLVGFRVTF